jgi:hypothetical protein
MKQYLFNIFFLKNKKCINMRKEGGDRVDWIGQFGIKKGGKPICGIWIEVKVFEGGFLRIDEKSKGKFKGVFGVIWVS